MFEKKTRRTLNRLQGKLQNDKTRRILLGVTTKRQPNMEQI